MTERIQIAITATDGATRVFEAVSTGATKMSTSMDKAAKSGLSFSKVGAAIGVGMGLAVTAFGQFGRAAADAEAADARIRSAVESTGATFEEFQGQIEAASNIALSLSFDDEDATDAMANITAATGDTAEAINRLGLVMDIARGRNIDLAAASKIVIAAEQGRYGSLARLGIVLDSTATKEEALGALQQKYAGQAQAYADTSAGAIDKFQNKLENLEEAIGAHAEAATSLALVAQGIGPAYTLASAALGGYAKSALEAAKASETLSKSSSLVGAAAKGLIGLFAGPVGVAAAFAGAALAFEKFGERGDGKTAEEVLNDTAKGAENLQTVLEAMAQTGAKDVFLLGDSTSNVLDGMMEDYKRWRALSDSINDDTTMEDFGLSAEQAGEEMGKLLDLYGSFDLSTEQFSSAQSNLAAILTNTGVGAELQHSALENLNAELAAGTITGAGYLSGLEEIAKGADTYNIAATLATETTKNLNTATEEYLNNLRDVSHNGQEYISAAAGLAGVVDTVTGAIRIQNVEQNKANKLIQQYYDLEQQAAGQAVADQQQQAATSALTAEAVGQQVAAMDALVAVREANAEAILKERDAQAAMVEATALTVDAVTAMDNVFQSVVGNTDAWAKSSQGIADWAETLVGAEGVAGRIDEILAGQTTGLAAATINQTEYNAAQSAYTDIARENLEIQQDVAVIQAKQAPLIAEQIAQTENYIQKIAEQTAAQQTVSLGFMDATQSGRALELQTLALSAAAGDLGTGGEQFASNIIVGAAEADGQLREMLVSMGLISVGADGTITVNFQDNATSQLAQLNATVEKLAYTQILISVDGDVGKANAKFEEVFGHAAEWDDTTTTATVDADSGPAQSAIDIANEKLHAWDGSVGTADANVNDNASGAIYAAIGALNSLDGMVANSYINTYVTTISSFIGSGTSPLGGRLGGVIGYANGGVVAQLAEAGPELLHFANGGMAVAPSKGFYNVPNGTYVDTAPETARKLNRNGGVNVVINVAGSVGVDDLAAQVSKQIVPAIQRAMHQHERSVGSY